jgi:glutaryl-CoA dehydrogenase
MTYQPLNLMDEESLLKPEEVSIRNTVREFVEKEVIPVLQDCNRYEKFPTQLIAKFGQMSLLGPTVKFPGSAGLSATAYGLLMQELERADSGIRSFCSVQGSLVMYPIATYGSEKQRQKYLPDLASGKLVGCFGLTEPDAGSNPGGMLCRAEKVPGGYKLNGNKMWITNGCLADVAVVWAKLNDKVQGFLVDKGTKGFSTTTMKGKFSLRVSVTSELHFQDCVIGDENILPEAKGLKAALACLSEARFGIAWGVIGAANTCFQTALEYSKTRKIFDQPLAHHQLAQAKLVKMAQEITKAQLLAWQLGQLKDSGRIQNAQISLAKMNNCKMALETAREARDMLGANGIIDEYPVVRHMLNLETVNTYEGTEDIHRLVVGHALTGMPAYR